MGRGRELFGNAPRWMDQIIGAWLTSGTQLFQSGYPIYIVASNNGTTTGWFCSNSATTVCGNGNALNDVYLRPNRVQGVNPVKSNWKKDPNSYYSSNGGVLNPNARSYPGSPGTPGTTANNPQFGNGRRTYGDVRNPRSIFWNASMRKSFAITPDRVKLQLYTDITNLMNHGNYYIQGNRLSNQGVYTNSLTTSGCSNNASACYTSNASFGDADGGIAMRTINIGAALTF